MSTAGEHHDEMNLIAVLDGFGKFIRVGAGMVEVNLHHVMKFIFFREDSFLHSRKLLNELIQTFPDRFSSYRHNLLTVSISAVSGMNMNFDWHGSSLSYE